MRRRAGVVAATALLAAGCGQAQAPTTAATPEVAPPGGIVLQIDHYGGFTASPRSRWLDLAVTDDGHLVTPQTAIPAIDPPFLYVGLQQVEPDAGRLAALLERAAAVVEDGKNFTDMQVADASTTRVRWWDGTGYRTTTAYALGMDGGSGTAELAGFVREAQDLAGSSEGAEDPKAYLPASLEVWSVPADRWSDTRTWPGRTRLSAVPPTSTSGPGAPRCHVESEVGPVLAGVQDASVRTRWEDEAAGPTWSVDLVPLLPGERGCGGELRE